MEKLGWKVVRRDDNGDFQSSRMRKSLGWCVPYKVGVRSTGCHGTPVLAFRTRATARNFQGIGDLLFKAGLENPRPIERLENWLHPEAFSSFWKQKGRGVLIAPDGTLVCDAITLLEPA